MHIPRGNSLLACSARVLGPKKSWPAPGSDSGRHALACVHHIKSEAENKYLGFQNAKEIMA